MCNESLEILEMFDSAFDALAAHPERKLFPPETRADADALNEFIRQNHVPTDMARRLREYAHQQKDETLRQHASRVAVPTLSTALQVCVAIPLMSSSYVLPSH